MVSSLLAGIPFSSLSVEDGDAVGADPRGTAAPKSATGWPASSRNGGRHQIGMVADIVSEQVAGMRRNPHVRRSRASASGEFDVAVDQDCGPDTKSLRG